MGMTRGLTFPATGAMLKENGWKSKGTSNCKYCDTRIIWARTPYGKMSPLQEVDPDDSGRRLFISHFTECPGADKARRR